MNNVSQVLNIKFKQIYTIIVHLHRRSTALIVLITVHFQNMKVL